MIGAKLASIAHHTRGRRLGGQRGVGEHIAGSNAGFAVQAVQAVREPASHRLMFGGLAALGLCRQRNRRRG